MIDPVAGGDDLRELMRLWPHGVSVLAVDNDGDRMGVTVSSLVSLSLEPPLVGISVGKQASLLRAPAAGRRLRRQHARRRARRRSRASSPRACRRSCTGTGVETREGQIAPLIEGALGWIEARTVAEHDVGDHTFFVGEVDRRPSRDRRRARLVYRDREYHAL